MKKYILTVLTGFSTAAIAHLFFMWICYTTKSEPHVPAIVLGDMIVLFVGSLMYNVLSNPS
jgi:ascorbate-specific PTS system EIIC-type component UlaA